MAKGPRAASIQKGPDCLGVYLTIRVWRKMSVSQIELHLRYSTCMYVCMYVWSSHISEYISTG